MMTPRLVLFTLCAFASLVQVSADGLSLKVTGPAQVNDISDLHIKATLKNAGTSAVTLVNDPRSMLSTHPANTFSISHESGANADFTGFHSKFSHEAAIKNGDITTLMPGQSIDVTHSLANAYSFAKSGPGSYEISPSTRFHAVSEAGNIQPIHASLENSHTVAITGSGRLVLPQQSGQRKRSPFATFKNCTADQQQKITEAIPVAKKYVNDSIVYLNSGTSESERFVKWFGDGKASRLNTVLSHFTKLNKTEAFTDWTYNCASTNCKKNTYANVRPSRYAVVNICELFWDAPLNGTDSRGGTLVHEGSHFNRVAGTDDIIYGQECSESLASTSPELAIENADNHEYFAENSPATP